MIKFGEYRPDDAALDNEGVTVAKNVLPGDSDYEPLPSATVLSSNALESSMYGAFAVRDPDTESDTFNFVGSQTKLNLLVSGSFTNVSKAGDYSSLSDNNRWSFAQVGNETIATNFLDNIQTYTVGTSSLFSDLGGSPPKARYVAKVDRFLVIAHINDVGGDGVVPQRVRWAGIGTVDSWTISSVTQADEQDLDNAGGWIMGIVGGEFGGLIFQEFAITRMTYVGSPIIFQFDQVRGANGAIAPGGIINAGDFVAYIGQDGFYLFDGQTAVPIGTNAVNQTFFDEFDVNFTDRVQATLVPERQIIAWSYRKKNSDATSPLNDKILFYNYGAKSKKRWSFAEIDHSGLFTSLEEGYTLEELDDFGDGNQTLETLPFSLDSKVYKGNAQLLSLINTDDKLAVLTGTALSAVIETGEAQLSKGKKTKVTLMRPFVDSAGVDVAATVTMEVGERNDLSESVTWSGAITLTTSGFAPVRSTARYHRVRVNISNDFNAAQGVDIVGAAVQGRR